MHEYDVHNLLSNSLGGNVSLCTYERENENNANGVKVNRVNLGTRYKGVLCTVIVTFIWI